MTRRRRARRWCVRRREGRDQNDAFARPYVVFQVTSSAGADLPGAPARRALRPGRRLVSLPPSQAKYA